jgi:hypothetical protein
MSDRYELSDTHNGILSALLEKKQRFNQRIDEQVMELTNLIRKTVDVGDDWRLEQVQPGIPKFALVPPEGSGEDGSEAD